MGSSISRRRRRAALRHGQTLLDLPIEVQVKILCYLDTGDLVACRSVCRTLLTICNDEMAVRYTSTLGGAGMVDDVPPQDVSLRDRYEAILKYLIAWKNVDSIPHRIHTPTQGEIFLEHTNSVSVYAIQDPARPALKLHRPGSQLTLSPELTFLCTAWTSVLETRMLSRVRYTVDLSQNLLIISFRVEGQEENINEHHFFSISGDQYPHPHAASSVLSAPLSRGRSHDRFTLGSNREDYVDVLSDLVVWSHRPRTSEQFSSTACADVQVTNWKTGAVVWRYTTNKVTYYYLIDRHHIVLILNNSIHVFAFNPDRHASQGPPAYTRPGAHLLHLKLPRFEFDVQLGDTTAVLRIPRPHPADCPLFRQDPEAALLALIMVVKTLEPGWSSWNVSHLTILVPLSTIRTHIGHTGARFLRTPALPWQDWGPGGARVVRTHEVLPWHIALHGSRCVLTNDTILEHVLVIDAHRWVRQAGPGLVRCKLLITEKDVDASDVVTFVTERSFVDRRKPIEKKTEQIEGRFPCRLMYEPIWGVPALRWKTTFATDEEVVLVCTQIE